MNVRRLDSGDLLGNCVSSYSRQTINVHVAVITELRAPDM